MLTSHARAFLKLSNYGCQLSEEHRALLASQQALDGCFTE